jgi:hypothetical protein
MPINHRGAEANKRQLKDENNFQIMELRLQSMAGYPSDCAVLRNVRLSHFGVLPTIRPSGARSGLCRFSRVVD